MTLSISTTSCLQKELIQKEMLASGIMLVKKKDLASALFPSRPIVDRKNADMLS